MQDMIQQWEEEKEQMLLQIRAYKRQSDELKRQIAAIQDEAQSTQKHSDNIVRLKEAINKLEIKVIDETDMGSNTFIVFKYKYKYFVCLQIQIQIQILLMLSYFK